MEQTTEAAGEEWSSLELEKRFGIDKSNVRRKYFMEI